MELRTNKKRIMKKLLCLFLLLGMTTQTFAQGIFNQKGEMIKKNIRQITLLATYSGYVRKGYRIMEDGWNTVHNWKDGEFNLHLAYIHSLKKVNPQIKEERVDAIRALAEDLLSGCTALRQDAVQSEMLTNKEMSYLESTLSSYIRETSENMEELNLIITDGKLSMTDDERIKQVDRLFDRMVKALREFKTLDRHTRKIIAGRKEMEQHNKELKQWMGITTQP
jgi:hypothetical protein